LQRSLGNAKWAPDTGVWVLYFRSYFSRAEGGKGKTLRLLVDLVGGGESSRKITLKGNCRLHYAVSAKMPQHTFPTCYTKRERDRKGPVSDAKGLPRLDPTGIGIMRT